MCLQGGGGSGAPLSAARGSSGAALTRLLGGGREVRRRAADRERSWVSRCHGRAAHRYRQTAQARPPFLSSQPWRYGRRGGTPQQLRCCRLWRRSRLHRRQSACRHRRYWRRRSLRRRCSERRGALFSAWRGAARPRDAGRQRRKKVRRVAAARNLWYQAATDTPPQAGARLLKVACTAALQLWERLALDFGDTLQGGTLRPILSIIDGDCEHCMLISAKPSASEASPLHVARRGRQGTVT